MKKNLNIISLASVIALALVWLGSSVLAAGGAVPVSNYSAFTPDTIATILTNVSAFEMSASQAPTTWSLDVWGNSINIGEAAQETHLSGKCINAVDGMQQVKAAKLTFSLRDPNSYITKQARLTDSSGRMIYWANTGYFGKGGANEKPFMFDLVALPILDNVERAAVIARSYDGQYITNIDLVVINGQISFPQEDVQARNGGLAVTFRNGTGRYYPLSATVSEENVSPLAGQVGFSNMPVATDAEPKLEGSFLYKKPVGYIKTRQAITVNILVSKYDPNLNRLITRFPNLMISTQVGGGMKVISRLRGTGSQLVASPGPGEWNVEFMFVDNMEFDNSIWVPEYPQTP